MHREVIADVIAPVAQRRGVEGKKPQAVDAEAGQEAGVLRSDLSATALAGALETIVFALLLGALQLGVGRDTERRQAIAAVISQGITAR